jgi:hypothetical protein
MATEWHYSKGGQQHSPVSAADLKALAKSGELLPTDMIWKEGMAEWKPAGSLKGLFPDSSGKTTRTAPPAIPQVASPSPTQDSLSTIKQAESPVGLAVPVIAGLAITGACLAFSIIGTLVTDYDDTRFLLVISVAHNIAAVVSLFNVLRLKHYSFARFAPWLAMTSWLWIWAFHPNHGIGLFGMVVAGSIGIWLVIAFKKPTISIAFDADPPLPPLIDVFSFKSKSALDSHYAVSPPSLPFSSPWSDEERGLSAGTISGVLLGLNRSLMYARWLPIGDDGGWIQLNRNGMFTSEKGESGMFRLLSNQQFIDIWKSGKIVDCFKIVSLKQTQIELQNCDGKFVKYKRSMTAGEALLLNPLALLETTNEEKHRHRLSLLQKKWEPINGDGPSIQFTDDNGNGDNGAYIRFDGFAARYSLLTKPPFDTITIRYGQEMISLTILSLERDELVLNGDGVSVHYKRGVSISAAEARRRADAFNEKVKTVGKAALVTAGAIGAGIAVLGVAAVAGAAGTGGISGAGSSGGDTNSGLVRCKLCGGQGVTRYTHAGQMVEQSCSNCYGRGWVKP